MKKLQLLFTAALMLGLSSFAFASTPKGDVKANNTDTKVAPVEAISETQEVMRYWFHVDGSDNIIPQTSTPSLQLKADTGCPDQNEIQDCARAFDSYTTNGLGEYVPLGPQQDRAGIEE